jgi:hypothetical protein
LILNDLSENSHGPVQIPLTVFLEQALLKER